MDPVLERIYGLDAKQLAACSEHLMVGGGTRGGPVLHHGKGVRVWDTDGKAYIDCTSQSWALYLGYCNDEIWETVDEHARNLTHVHQGFDTLPRFALAERIAGIMPAELNRVSFVPTSAIALEGAMKLALKNRPGSAHFLCLMDSYHGTTLGTMGASWISTQSPGYFAGGSRFLPLTRQFIRVPNPYRYRPYFSADPDENERICLTMLELTLQKGVNGPAAGFIVEPLQASGGMIPLTHSYMRGVREICDRYGVPLIFDEIQTFVRMGKWTAAEYYGVTPDVIALGKAVGGGLPLGVTILRDGLEGYSPDAEELHTFANNSLAQVAALKMLDIIERDDIMGNTTRMGAYLRDGLLKLQQQFPRIGDIRQAGLHIGVEVVKDPETREPDVDAVAALRAEAMQRGLIIGVAGVRKNLFKIKPALVIRQAECDEVLSVLEDALKAALA
ncbi:MAG: aspartate aminotransferase family protein [Lentisphaerae bacterium]|jgi:4-aminobutyrate aminotransferase-like enzyme|nr:aspartate aminotransferase family protein [Lentisphaerota bacterium]MBT4821306.1 aspartate aminotransferase family protein [Lentisphaerota bacterium]MBT5609869.1 aspartate aminotransferase family protein [Lentisphaerota bacterium]MBT7060010.1 aspartate aminotransferase family protein [Lentisphaerota bacterium]MBT7842493.1 aspartate aminotransferase family protein [Lentisphaerota bacterium]